LKKKVFILVIALLQTILFSAQNSELKLTDSIANAQKEQKAKHLDSMVKHIRKQFYGNNLDVAIELGEPTLELANELNNLKAIVAISSLMGNAFLKVEDTLQAKRIFTNAIEKAEKEHDSTRVITTARIDLGNYYALQSKRKEAIEIYKKALPLPEKLKDTTHLYIINYNIAELFLDDKDVINAQFYVEETNNYVKGLNPDAYHAGAKLLTGKLYFLQNNTQKAIEVLTESVKLSEKSGFQDGLIEGHDFLAKAYQKEGNLLETINHMQLLDTYKSEKYKSDKIEAIEYATAKYKTNFYQQEIKSQLLQNEINKQTAKRETTIFWIKIASAILIISAIFLFISYRKRKQLLYHLIDKNKQYLEEKEKSEELAKAKSILFSNITHELRTPMYGIIGISSILMRDAKLKNHKENLASLKFSANHLLSLINNVLQLTSIYSTKKEELKRNKFSLREIVENIVKSSKFINASHPNKYIVNIDDQIPEYLIGDEVKISQILINLIGNASKFTFDGEITINLTRVKNQNNKLCVHFNIKDTGVGISEEKLEMIFDEFLQSNNNDQHQGTGLGLPIVKKILDIYESEITIKSTVGEGTEIDFELCYEETKLESTQNKDTHKHSDSLLKGKNILVVDDNKINLLVTKKTLMAYGANVSIAPGGAEGIKMANEEKFDLILMDINMPEVNGFEATKAIRQKDTHIPIIALTAVEMEKVVGESSFNLMNDFIIKPYKNNIFLDTIAKHISERQLLEV